MCRSITAALILLAAPLASAAQLDVSVEIPRLDVAEYHRPYVAIWIENLDQSVAANLAVWYEVSNPEGPTWLKDMRQWWRRSGRSLDVPIDGVTGATKPAGRHELTFSGDDARLSGLAAGDYRLVVEAAREVGGRELLRIPFAWPPKAASSETANGAHELGDVTLLLTP